MAIKTPSWLKDPRNEVSTPEYEWDYEGFKQDKANYKSNLEPPLLAPNDFRKQKNFQDYQDSFTSVAPPEKSSIWDKARNFNFDDTKLGKVLNDNPVYNFFNNLSIKTDNALMPGSAPVQPKDQGKFANKVTDIGGDLLSYAAPVPGLKGESLVSTASKLAKPLEEKLVNRLGNTSLENLPKLQQYGVNAVRTGAEFGGINALQSATNGDNLKDTLKSTGEGFATGALMGTLGKGLVDEVIPRVFPKLKPVNTALEPDLKQGDISTPLDKMKPIDNINPSIGATDRTRSISQIVSSDAEKSKLKPKDWFEKAYTRFIDTNSPIKKVDEGTYIKATNSKNVGGTVDYILQNGLVDRQGNKMGESLKSIVKDIPKNEEDSFMNYVLQKHNIDRAREGKPVYADFTPEQSLKAASIIEKQHPEYKQLNDRLVKFLNDFNGEWGNKSGLISNDLWNELQTTYKNYVPTQRSFTELEQGVSKTNGKGFTDQSIPLSRATGSERDIINPVENIMGLVNRTVRTARYNEVGQDLVKAIEKNPEGLRQFAEIIPEGTQINPNVNNIVSVLVNGKPVNVQVNNKPLLESLQSIHKTNVGDIEKAAKTATNMFKQLITQKNPVFAARNIARDIPTAYVNGNEANPLKFTKDLFAAGKDLATNSEIAQKYHAIGGGGSNFFNSNNTAKTARELVKTSIPQKIGNAIETFNNITESAPRLAEFKRELNKTGDIQKALYAANDVTTNFSKGGDIAKHADSFIPYLNASLQGLDKQFRQFKNHPLSTTAKGVAAITIPSLAFNYMNKDNPNYQELDNRTKDNYFLIPNGDTFIKIPKSRELGVLFGSLAERTLRQIKGEQNAFKGFGGFKGTAATNISPTNPLENNILSPVITNLPSNKDFAGRPIVPQSMQDRSPQYQYDEKTSEISKKIGELTGLSPKQIDYVIKSYTGVIGQMGLPAATLSNYDSKTPKANLLKSVTTQFVADPLYSNQNLTDFYDNLDAAKKTATDKNFTENIPSKKVTKEEEVNSGFTRASKAISDLSKQADQASRQGDIEKARQLRAQMIQIAINANKGSFPATKK